MQSSLAGNRQGAGLPERIATRIHLLLESYARPRSGRAIPGSACGRSRPPPSTALPALRRRCAARSISSLIAASFPRRCCEIRNASCKWPIPGSFYRVLTVEEYEQRLVEFLGKERHGVPRRGRPGAFSPAPIAAHRAARRARRGHAVRRHRRAFQSRRRHSRPGLSPRSARSSWRATASRACRMARPAASP